MKFFLLAVIVLVAVAVFWLRRRNQNTETDPVRHPGTVPAPRPSAFHAVTIVPGPDACAAARQAKAERRSYLSKEAPRLPLEGCDKPSCTCRYAHHEDRRINVRRALDRGDPTAPPRSGEQRQQPLGRRKTDTGDPFA